jgi:hypothetical protein
MPFIRALRAARRKVIDQAAFHLLAWSVNAAIAEIYERPNRPR